jgi:hypothetical protein
MIQCKLKLQTCLIIKNAGDLNDYFSNENELRFPDNTLNKIGSINGYLII